LGAIVHASLEARIKAVYPTGLSWERVDDQLGQNDYIERVKYVLEESCRTLPLSVYSQRWFDPADEFAFTHADAPNFDAWIRSMDNSAKINWIQREKSPYVVLWIKVSRVADYYIAFFNHWRPRVDTACLDADSREKPNEHWCGYSKAVFRYFHEKGFLLATPEFLQERVPFVLTWGGNEIPDDDPRWNDDNFEPEPIPATVDNCIFGDQ
jgi:hypothetical protein